MANWKAKLKKTNVTRKQWQPGDPFGGEVMHCIMCQKNQKSDPNVQSDWTLLTVDGIGYYVCPDCLQNQCKTEGDFKLRYIAIFEKIQELRR